MSLPRFEYRSPSTLAEALDLAGEGSVFAAGGTDLFVRMKERTSAPKRVVGLGQVAELRGIDDSPAEWLRIGAGTTLAELEEHAAGPRWEGLGEAVRLASSPLLRNAGTVGGNLCLETRCTFYNQPAIFRKRWGPCLKAGGSVCHAVRGGKTCFSVHSGDLAGVLVAAGATATVASPRGSKRIGVGQLFSGSGIRPTALGPDEILTEIRVPPPPRFSGLSYQKLCLRDTIDFPILGVSFLLELDGKGPGARCRGARVVLTAAGPAPTLIEDAPKLLRGRVVTGELAQELGALVLEKARPVANTASSPSYRRKMAPVLARRALASALERAAGRDG